MSGQTAAIVLAAGAGTRMKSKTPKVLQQLAGKTLLAHALDAVTPWVDTTIAVIGFARTSVETEVLSYNARRSTSVHLAVQEQQDGTGGAVAAGLEVLPSSIDTVLVTYADVPLLQAQTLQDLLDKHTGSGNKVTVLTFHTDTPTGYGRIVRTDQGEVAEIVEEKDATDQQREITEVNSGIYAFSADFLHDILPRITENHHGERYLTDVIAHAKEAVGTWVAEDTTDLLGCNDQLQLAVVRKIFNRRIVHQHLLSGVVIIDPETTWVDADVAIASDAVIYPNSYLYGATSIAANTEIGPETTLRDTHVHAEAKVLKSHVDSAIIENGATVGPFSYVRPGTQLGAGGKIGAFAETKNASIGRGAKVPHLNYVGDATVGEGTNIGAGAIVVNFDGENKHHTSIGSHVRIGAGSLLIAPVDIGDGSYTGADTVVLDNVPPGSLAVSEGNRQRIIKDWTHKKRPGTDSARAAHEAHQVSTGDNNDPVVNDD